MAMKAWIIVPDSGLNIDGVHWDKGEKEITDSGWYGLLVAAGAVPITEEEYGSIKAGDAGNGGEENGAAGAADTDQRPRAKRRKRSAPAAAAESAGDGVGSEGDAAGGAERGEG
jgi:hypothetical protein